MLRHVQNLNELVVYASISCGAAFVARLYPAFHYPIFLVRVGVVAYCFVIISSAEGNKHLAFMLSGALLLGMLGGNWDWIEIYLKFNQDIVGRYLSLLIFGVLLIMGVVYYAKPRKK